jgi:hypothetical protein
MARRIWGVAALGFAVLLLVIDPPWTLPGGPGFFAERGESLIVTAKIALWWAALANALLCVALSVSAPLWTGERQPAVTATETRSPSALWWAAVLLAALLGAGLRLPLSMGSLYWDEAWTVKRAVVGSWEPASGPADDAQRAEREGSREGELEFEPVPWRKTLWAFKKPTNHVGFSVAGRVTTDLWRAATGRPPGEFSELALRFPSLAACVLAIVGVALLVRDWGFARAGVAAAFLLAIHPWHVRLGPAARGYGLMLLFALAAALALGRALESDRGRWWAAYPAALFGLFWSQPFALYLALSLGVAAVFQLWVQRRRRAAARFVAANIMAGMALLFVMAPNFAQVPLWDTVHAIDEGVRVRVKPLLDLWAKTVSGVPESVEPSAPDVAFPSLSAWRAERPWLALVDRGLVPLLLLAGLLAALRRAGPRRAVVVGLTGAVPLAILGAVVQQHSFYVRFSIYALAAAVPLLAVGTEALAARVGGRAVAPALASLVLGFAIFTWPQNRMLLERPHSGMRETVEFLAAQGDAESVLKAGLGLGGDNPKVYDPRLGYFENADELRALCAEAESRAVPFYAYYAYPGHNRARSPGAFRLLDDPSRFEPVARFDGVEPQFVYRVFRWTGASCVRAAAD